MTKKKYTGVRKCRECGENFYLKAEKGNPYKYCPDCRQKKYNELIKIVKGEK